MTPTRPTVSSLTVSVVIPVLDDAAELAVCLRALAAQTHVPDEVVVVDNGSADDSAAVARAAGARLVHEPRRGIPYAAAAGYDAATCDVIARLDADSRPSPGWLERITAVMTHPDVDAVTGPGRFHDLPVVVRTVAAWTYLGAYFGSTALAVGGVPLWGSNMAVRRTVWHAARDRIHVDADVHDDMDLTFALGPDATVRFDRRLRVDVSARSLHLGPQWRARMGRAVTTLRLNWAHQPPWERWRRRLATRDPRRSR